MVCDNIFVQFSGSGDGRFREFHIKDKYKTVGEALNLFKDDELLSEPGESITSFCLIWPNSQPQLLYGQVWKGLLSQTFRHIWVRAVLGIAMSFNGRGRTSLSLQCFKFLHSCSSVARCSDYKNSLFFQMLANL